MSTDMLEPLPLEWDYLPEEKKALLRRGIGSRLRLLVVSRTPEKKRFEELEKKTGISSATWRTWWRREGSPSGRLIESAARAWPEHAFWLATGLTDVEAGHNLPSPPHPFVKPYIDPYPESPFSAESYADENPSWASLSDDPESSFGKWTPGAKEFLESTAEYLRLCRDLQDDFWSKAQLHRVPTPRTDSLQVARMEMRKVRWSYAPYKSKSSKNEAD